MSTMPNFSPLYMMPVILGVLFWLLVFASVIIIPTIYLLARSPNRIISSIFSYKIWGAGILLTVGSIGFFLSNALAQLGFREEDTFSWPMDNLRIQLVLLIIGGYLLIIGKSFLPASIFDTEKSESKSPLLYASHIFHTYGTGILIFLEAVLIGVLANFLLKYGLIEFGEVQENGLHFFVNFVSVLVPTMILGLFFLPSFHSKKRFYPKMKSEAVAIFELVLFFGAGLLFLFTFGVLFQNGLIALLDKPDILGEPIDKNETRDVLILFVIAVVFIASIWRSVGGKDAFQKK